MKVIGVIPARYASVRFPGKPLVPLAGRPMVLHVLAAARAARRLDEVLIATDDSRIADVVRENGGEALLTSPDAATGTDRLAEAARHLGGDVYVNVQGDEPLMLPENVDAVVETLLANPDREIATKHSADFGLDGVATGEDGATAEWELTTRPDKGQGEQTC